MTWLTVVLLIAVGVPLLAVWVSRWSFWSKDRPGRQRDAWGDLMRAHGLGPAAMARVESAAAWGKRLEDPSERAAVVEMARAAMPRMPPTRWGRLFLLASLVYLVLLVAGGVWALVSGRWSEVPWVLVVVLVASFAWNPLRAARRAIELNTD